MMLQPSFPNPFRGRPRTRRPGRAGPRPDVEALDGRVTPAVIATFNPGAGLLTVLGDALDTAITVGRDAAGTIVVNGGAVRVLGGAATVANTATIQVFGQGGNDSIALDETNGALPRADLFGGDDDDVLTGGSGADRMFGQAGSDTLLGRGGIDLLFGGAGADTLTGGAGDDQVFGEGGNDRLVWNPGDDTDLDEGGAGDDTVEVDGGAAAETFSVAADGARVRIARAEPAPFSLDIGTAEHLIVNAHGGDDTFTAGGGLARLIGLAVDAGPGNDTIRGGDGDDFLLGGFGEGAAAEFDNDTIIGGRGNDTIIGGFGQDLFVWDPGDGSDSVTGGAGDLPVEFPVPDFADMLVFNGSDLGEHIAISPNGGNLRLTRDVDHVTMDLVDIERITIVAGGGADELVLGDASGIKLDFVGFDLSASPGGASDGEADTVVVNGTGGADLVAITGFGNFFFVQGLPADVAVGNTDPTDRLIVNGLGGDDQFAGVFEATGAPSPRAVLTLDGGLGDDTIRGSAAADVLIGGDGDDTLIGSAGDDTLLGGAGDDTFVWNPGDGSDIVEGQAGLDELRFNGSDADERIDVSADGRRVRLSRDVADVAMDLNEVEGIVVNAPGGADTITVHDLAGTDLARLDLNLASPPSGGAGDGRADAVIVEGTEGEDAVAVAGDAGGVSIIGLSARVNIEGAEAASDRLTVNSLGGDDVLDASGLSDVAIPLTADGGDDDDVLIGGAGADTLAGGAGNDILIGGPGPDALDGAPGEDILFQG
jgi:Ca2+-binding RTX toxin-like protein